MVSFKVGRGERFFQMFLGSVSLFLYISMFIAHLVAYLSSLLELPRRDRTGHDHQGRQSTEIPFFLHSYSSGRGKRWPKPRSKICKIFSDPNICYLYLKLHASIEKTLSLKCFQIAPANINTSCVYLLSSKLISCRASELPQLYYNRW